MQTHKGLRENGGEQVKNYTLNIITVKGQIQEMF